MQTPPPGTYNLDSSFDGSSPTIKGNALTTNFSFQCSRAAYDMVYVPGSRSPRGREFVPGPGTYAYKNMAIGHDTVKFTIKSRVKNMLGEDIRTNLITW